MNSLPFLSVGRTGRAVLASGLVLSHAAVMVLRAQTPGLTDDEEVKLEAFSVTGSRIKRIDTETPQPVVRLTSADFSTTGFSTLGDAIRSMPIISGQSLSSVDAGTSFTPGVSSFNLRGLGNNSTLVLINGRRAAPYGTAGYDGFQTVFDFNSIPVAAVESLEVLKDGASAIYGSDAVAGVINITLRKDYSGVTTELNIGNTIDTDSFEKGFFVLTGANNAKSSIVATMDWNERKSIYGRDLDYTDESDGTPYGGFNQGSSRWLYGNVYGLTDRVTFPSGTATFKTPQTNPTLAAAVPGSTIYNFQELAGYTPETRSYGFYTRGTYDFTDTIQGFAEVSYRRSEVLIDSAPTPLATQSENGDGPNGNIVFPASNPYNPFGQDIQDLRWRLAEVGNRQQDVQSDTSRILVGLNGELPVNDWTWEVASLYTKNDVSDIGRNYVADRLLQDAFNGVVIDGDMLYANPFGPNDPRIIDYMRVDTPNYDTYSIRSSDVSVGGSLIELPAGPLAIAIGGEIREEKLTNTVNGLNSSDGLVGGGSGSGTTGDRKVYAGFVELSIPLVKNQPGVKNLEVQLAGRAEDYSDFGDTVKPKVAVVYQPIEEVLLRGSFGQSFLAPNLPYLYTARSVSFTSNTLADPLRPNDPRNQIRQFGGGNPDLDPEESDITYLGLVLQPFSRQKGSIFRELSFGVDYIHFDQTNLLGRLDAEDILDPDNYAQYQHLVLRNPPAAGESVGTINGVVTTWQNLDDAVYEAYDFNIRWVLPEYDLGQFRFELSWTYLADYDYDGLDVDGTWNYPLNRANFTVGWKRGNWAASTYVTYIGDYEDGFEVGRVGEQFVVNPQVSYRGFFDSTITLGVRNVFNDDPPVDITDAKLVNNSVNLGEPFFWYMRWSKDW